MKVKVQNSEKNCVKVSAKGDLKKVPTGNILSHETNTEHSNGTERIDTLTKVDKTLEIQSEGVETRPMTRDK